MPKQTEREIEFEQMKTRLEELEPKVAELKKLHDDNFELTTKLEEVQGHNTALTQEAELAVKEITCLKDRIAELESDPKAIEAMLAKLQHDIHYYLDSHTSTSNTQDAAAIAEIIREHLIPPEPAPESPPTDER